MSETPQPQQGGEEAIQSLVQEASEYEEAQANARLLRYGKVAVEQPPVYFHPEEDN